MKSMMQIMAETDAQVKRSRFLRTATGGATVGRPKMAGNAIRIEARNCVRLRNVADAAKRLGVSHGHLSRVLKGERKAGRRLESLMTRLGVRLTGKGAV